MHCKFNSFNVAFTRTQQSIYAVVAVVAAVVVAELRHLAGGQLQGFI